MNFATQRTWKVVNDNNTTGIGAHPAYKLVPGAAFPPLFDPARRSWPGARLSSTASG